MSFRVAAALLAFVVALLPTRTLACACGCGVFTVGTSAMLPNGTGGTAYLEYDYLDQASNHSGASSAPAADNDDKDIRSDFYTLGAQYMFDRDWGLSLALPYTRRVLQTAESGSLETVRHDALGDARLVAKYTGFSEDLSSGLLFGLKLPTGDYSYAALDRDTSIGTGTTDAILGGYHVFGLDADNDWTGFVNVQWDYAFAARAGYRPGNETDAILGAYYAGWEIGKAGSLAPVFQLILSDRGRDRGAAADPDDTGYRRLHFAPGLEYDAGPVRLYADIEVPLYQYVNGNQLVADRQYKFIVSYKF